jgi:hypothetical protein
MAKTQTTAEIPDPTPIFADIETAGSRMRHGDMKVGASLDKDIEALTTLMEMKDLNPESLVVLRYYRALAYFMRNEFNAATSKGSYDDGLAQKTLSELAQVIATISGQTLAGDGKSWANIKANALFFAGTVAYNQIKDSAGAYRFWSSCAAMDHAGCLNVMAVALTTGDGGLAPDLTEALRMHKRVFETATRYGCAGVFSAYSAAVLVALGGVKNTKDNAEIWITNASYLLNAVQMDKPDEDLCSRADIQFAQYLIGWSHGKKDTALLDAVMATKAATGYAETARYLKGDLDQERLEQGLSGSLAETRCNGLFYALWAADIAHDATRARHFQSLIASSRDISCRIDAAYAKSAKTLQ